MDGVETAKKVTTKSTQDEKDLYLKNSELYYSLLKTTQGVPREIVDGSTTTDLPRGCLKTAWDALKKEYSLKNTTDALTKIEEFTNCKPHHDNEDPRLWFSRIRKLKNELDALGISKQDMELAGHVLAHLPAVYHPLKVTLKVMLKNNSLDWDTLTKQVKAYYDDTIKTNDLQNSLAMMSMSSGRRCTHCGMSNHDSKDCFRLPENRNK